MYFKEWLEKNKLESYFLGEELTWDSGEEVEVVRKHKKRTDKKENEDRKVLPATIPDKIKTVNLKGVNTYSNKKYWFRCSKCDSVFQSVPKTMCYPREDKKKYESIRCKKNKRKYESIHCKKKRENLYCRYCNVLKNKGKEFHYHYPTLKNWESESDIKVVGELIEDKDKYIVNPIKTDTISMSSKRKLVFGCELHDRYEELTIREVCLGNRRKKVDNYKYQMECCREENITLFEWCLLFYYYEFDINNGEQSYNGQLVLEHYRLMEVEKPNIEDILLLKRQSILFACTKKKEEWINIKKFNPFKKITIPEDENIDQTIFFSLPLASVVCGKRWCEYYDCEVCKEVVYENKTKKFKSLERLTNEFKINPKMITKTNGELLDIEQTKKVIEKLICDNKRIHRLVYGFVYKKQRRKQYKRKKVERDKLTTVLKQLNDKLFHLKQTNDASEEYTRRAFVDSDYYALITHKLSEAAEEDCYYFVDGKDTDKVPEFFSGVFVKLNAKDDFLFKIRNNDDEITLLKKSELKKYNFVVDMESNPKYMGNKFTKLKGDGLRIEYKDAYIPENITEIDADFFDTCKFTGKLTIPKSLLPKLVEVGFKESSGVNIDFISNSPKMTLKSQRGSNYTEFLNVFKKDEILRMYEDRLTLVDKSRNEREYINNFKWKKFYNSEEELATCLMLSWFGIVTATDMTGGLVDIYRKKD